MLIQLAFMLKYSIIQVKNNMFSYLVVLVLCLLVAILLASVYSAQDQNSQAGLQNRVGILFFLVSGAFFVNMLFLDTQVKVFLSYQRHRAHGYFGVVTYFLFWLTTSAAVRFVGGALFVAVLYALARLKATYWSLDGLHDLVTILAMTSFSTCCVVWLIVCISPSPRFSHLSLFGIYAFTIVLAGLILNIASLPEVFQRMSFASLIRLGYESAVVSQFVNQGFGCVSANSTDREGQPKCMTGNQYIESMGFSVERQWKNVALMSYITLGVVVLVFFAMLRKRQWKFG